MRLKSSIFVAALIRSESSKGAFCTILNKGAEEAGAIFICHNKSRDNSDFYGPVSQSVLPQDHASDRYFEVLKTGLADAQVSQFIEKQMKFDTDIWVVEIETPQALEDLNILSQDES
ncbi:MAG: DUF1491 family protein [Nitratireductor sp.]